MTEKRLGRKEIHSLIPLGKRYTFFFRIIKILRPTDTQRTQKRV